MPKTFLRNISLLSISLILGSSSYAKNIVVFLDGTGNNECENLEENADTTNIYRLFKMTAQTDKQVVKYIRGIQSFGKAQEDAFITTDSLTSDDRSCTLEDDLEAQTFIKKETRSKVLATSIGFSIGSGMNKKADLALAFIKEKYKSGDKVYIFGFSRGAGSAIMAAQKAKETPIHLLGIWDAVFSKLTDLPISYGTKGRNFNTFRRRADHIQSVTHLLALDEARLKHGSFFTPARFSVPHGDPDDVNLNAVWFVGTHNDIGGGLKNRYLAEISLNYMIAKALEGQTPLLLKKAEQCQNEAFCGKYTESMLYVADAWTALGERNTIPFKKMYQESGGLQRELFQQAFLTGLFSGISLDRFAKRQFDSRLRTPKTIQLHPSVDFLYKKLKGSIMFDSVSGVMTDAENIYPKNLVKVRDSDDLKVVCVSDDPSIDVEQVIQLSPKLCGP
ncbi:hypothetical protein COB52_04735 [Candidatus Kaiserbacteria bacterium]|nr:MAG: hypothetical protein COB52_04735 [Candidatus Kaiserbacteria bacterium]